MKVQNLPHSTCRGMISAHSQIPAQEAVEVQSRSLQQAAAAADAGANGATAAADSTAGGAVAELPATAVAAEAAVAEAQPAAVAEAQPAAAEQGSAAAEGQATVQADVEASTTRKATKRAPKKATAKTWGKGGSKRPVLTVNTCKTCGRTPAPVIRTPVRTPIRVNKPCYGKGGKGGSCTPVPNFNVNTWTPAPTPCGSYGCPRPVNPPVVLPPFNQNNLRPPPPRKLPPSLPNNIASPPPPFKLPPLPPSGENSLSPSPPPPPPGPCASEYVCLPAASFTSQSVPLGKTVWLTAVFTHSQLTNFAVAFSNVSVTLRPKPGFVGYTRTISGRPYFVQLTAAPVQCSAATWSSSRNAYIVSSSTSNAGTTLLAAQSFSTPTDLANHDAIM